MGQVVFNVKLPITIKKKARVYISRCPILDIYSQGNSETEAKKNLIEAVKLFLITCFEKGTLDLVLKSCGFKAVHKTVKASKDHRFINVPIPFNVKSQRTSECHV